MIRKIQTFIGILLITFSMRVGFIYAVNMEISEPVGRNILPGGGFAAEDIHEGFVFVKLIPFVIKYAIQLAVALSVIALIIGGYRYITAYGDTEKHQTAQRTIMLALIGLVIAITAYGLVAILTSIQLT